MVLIRHCRRFIPGPAKLLPRMEALGAIYANIPDARTRLPLFSKKAWIKWNALKDHVRVGCLSDPLVDEAPLYSERGIRKDGSVVLACSRGTNGLEGYHQKVARVASGKNAGPQLAQSLMSEFTYRWNFKMALLSYGLPREYAFFNEQHMIQEVQLLTRIFYPDSPLYPEWRSSVDFASTGETFGVVVQVCGQENLPPCIPPSPQFKIRPSPTPHSDRPFPPPLTDPTPTTLCQQCALYSSKCPCPWSFRLRLRRHRTRLALPLALLLLSSPTLARPVRSRAPRNLLLSSRL